MVGLKNVKQKYFIALVLQEPALSAIEAIKQELFEQHNLRGALRSPAHITLHRPFEWREDREAQLIEALSAFVFGPEVTLQINGFDSFPPRVLYAAINANQALVHLHNRLTEHCKKTLRLFNESEDLRGFHPHITIAFRDLKKPLYFQLAPEFERKKLDLTLNFSGFSLLKLEKTWKVWRNY